LGYVIIFSVYKDLLLFVCSIQSKSLLGDLLNYVLIPVNNNLRPDL